ncbi:MAG TPA: lipopolysaccharide assembly protein LapA domain-containing protein [Pseudonocardiaceae bacterium]|jgi:uncharacterized integral membrane protein|nr:lipopolysaccharide assembly protein LapA domain-containing protein [Pseudonocardiaceae bacterium]
MVDHEHRIDAPDTDPIPVQAAIPTPAIEQNEHDHDQHRTALPKTEQPTAQRVRRTRISGLWVGVTVAALVLLVLLVFIIQNGQSVTISFFSGHLTLPLGVALLLAAICGVLLLAIPGYGRIIQLRRTIRRSGNTRPTR